MFDEIVKNPVDGECKLQPECRYCLVSYNPNQPEVFTSDYSIWCYFPKGFGSTADITHVATPKQIEKHRIWLDSRTWLLAVAISLSLYLVS